MTQHTHTHSAHIWLRSVYRQRGHYQVDVSERVAPETSPARCTFTIPYCACSESEDSSGITCGAMDEGLTTYVHPSTRPSTHIYMYILYMHIYIHTHTYIHLHARIQPHIYTPQLMQMNAQWSVASVRRGWVTIPVQLRRIICQWRLLPMALVRQYNNDNSMHTYALSQYTRQTVGREKGTTLDRRKKDATNAKG
jgi:hypothetical protein